MLHRSPQKPSFLATEEESQKLWKITFACGEISSSCPSELKISEVVVLMSSFEKDKKSVLNALKVRFS